MAPSLELVLGIPLPLQYRAVDRVEFQVVLRSSKVEEAKSVHVSLVPGRQRYLLINHVINQREVTTYSVNGGLDVVAGQERQSVTGVYR